MPHIVLLPGDGIGPEVVAATVEVLNHVAGDLDYETHLVGGAAIDETGTALPDATLEACRTSDAVLLGAVGGPKWDTTDPDKPRPEQGLLGLRAGLRLFANLRPVKPFDALLDASPLKREILQGTNLLVVRELTGGIYFGRKEREPDRAVDECVYTRAEIERIARVAFNAAGARSRGASPRGGRWRAPPAPPPPRGGRACPGSKGRRCGSPPASGARSSARPTARSPPTPSSSPCSPTPPRCSSPRRPATSA